MDKVNIKVEMLPPAVEYFSLRSVVSVYQWKLVSKAIYIRAGYKCEICGGRGTRHPIECHELWHFNKKSNKQKLIGFQGLCPYCHMLKHIGHTLSLGKLELAVQHAMKVNGWSDKQARRAIEKACHVYDHNKVCNWRLDISYVDLFLQQIKRMKNYNVDDHISEVLYG